MKRSYKVIAGIAATLSLGVAAGAYAMGPMGGGMGPMGGMGGMGPGGGGMGPRGGMVAGGNPAAMAEAHLTQLKADLKIQPSQEGAWTTFATKAKQQAETMQTMGAPAPATTGTAPERMAQRTEIMKQRIGSMDAMTAAVKDLYAVLTPEQKVIADQRFGTMGPGRVASSTHAH